MLCQDLPNNLVRLDFTTNIPHAFTISATYTATPASSILLIIIV